MSGMQAAMRLGVTQVGMGATRRRVDIEVAPHSLPGTYFLVRHADGAVYATAVAAHPDDLQRVLETLEHARERLWAAGMLDREPGQAAVALCGRRVAGPVH